MNNQENNHVNDQGNEKKEQYAPHFDQYEKKEQTIIYILWQIQNRKIRVGSKLFFEPLNKKFGLSKSQWPLVKEFLSGAGLLVDQVVIAETIPKYLKERYGIVNE